MVLIPAGEFTMGASPGDLDARPDEKPAHRAAVSAFWIDRTEVTNAQFARFIAATNYITTAERLVEWDTLKQQLPPGTPKPPDDQLQPGALVFHAPDVAPGTHVPLGNPSLWWRWTPGANWRHPEGPASSIEGKERHPVVQVSFEDAQAFATWAHKRLPTEAEWERAARANLEGTIFPWNSAFEQSPPTGFRANLWQGDFPLHNDASDRWGDAGPGGDGFITTAPVGSFPPNPFGLYDMAGNVWEWCQDKYEPYAERSYTDTEPEPLHNLNPATADRVMRGGSYLCSEQYCTGYRVSARMKTSPDTALMHLGFGCAADK
jgi:formylglycine-generating enzyme required for sulfatase activity